MLEFSQDEVRSELVVHPRVEYADHDVVHSQIVSHQDEPRVGHYPEPSLRHCVAAVLQVALKQVQKAVVLNRVLWPQFVVRNLFGRHLHAELLVGCDHRSQRQIRHVFNAVLLSRNEPKGAFIRRAECPIADGRHLDEVWDLGSIFLSPVFALLHKQRLRDHLNLIEQQLVILAA
jgi:hypothetical protein